MDKEVLDADRLHVLTFVVVAPALPALLTAQEVADVLRVSRSSIYRWAEDGTLEAITIGDTVRFRRADVEQLLSGERSG